MTAQRPHPSPLRLVPNEPPPSTTTRIQQLIDADGTFARGLEVLAGICGAVEHLGQLDTAPLAAPHEGPPLTGAANDISHVIARSTLWGLDDEYRVAIDRLLRRAAQHRSGPLDRRTSPTRLAAALTWIVLTGNMAMGRGSRSRWSARDIWSSFCVGDCSSLARAVADDLDMKRKDDRFGAQYPNGDIFLGDIQLLHSETRRSLIRLRDVQLRALEQIETERRAARPLIHRGDGKIEMRAIPRDVLSCSRVSVGGRDQLFVLFGTDAADPDEIVVISVPDAHALVHRLNVALDGPALDSTAVPS